MDIDITGVKVIGVDFAAEGVRNVYQCLLVILTTPKGTVPLDRDFGVNLDVLDQPLNVAKNRIAVEYVEAVRRYEPRADIKEVQWETDELEGKLVPTVVIEIDIDAA